LENHILLNKGKFIMVLRAKEHIYFGINWRQK